MNDHHDRPHLFLVGELLEQVLEEARRKLSGVVRTPDPIGRIARRRRRSQPPSTVAPKSAEEARNAFAKFVKEMEIEQEREALRRSAEEARRLRDATDEKRHG